MLRLENGIANRSSEWSSHLLTNAMKFGAGKPIEISVTAQEDRACLQVKDLGIGIAEEDQRKLFKRFERIAPLMHFGGLGLGFVHHPENRERPRWHHSGQKRVGSGCVLCRRSSGSLTLVAKQSLVDHWQGSRLRAFRGSAGRDF